MHARMMSDKNKNNLGRILKQRRVMIPLTLKELAATSDVSSSYLGRIENGQHGMLTRWTTK